MTDPNHKPRSATRSTRLTWAAALSAAFCAGAGFATLLIFGFAQSSLFDPPAPDAALPAESAAASDEKPFYTVGKRTRGPLTLEELQVDIPEDLARMMTARERACYIEKIGELAEAAGDPETLDPADVAFLPTDGSWDELTFFGRRSLLAQAIVSRAITLC